MNYRIPASAILLVFLLSGISRSQVAYHDSIQPLFNSHCTACHGGTSGVTLSSYNSAINSVGDQYNMNVVVPGQPDQSPMVNKINPNPSHGDRMPQGGPYLSDEQINLIRQWIAEGALESPATDIARNDDLPAEFELLGNYPNPFNPVTNVRFSLPVPADWNMTIYTTTGRIMSQHSGSSQAGIVSVPVDLGSGSSGMYVYIVELRPGATDQVRLAGNMLLIK
jgi:hypothetical protein